MPKQGVLVLCDSDFLFLSPFFLFLSFAASSTAAQRLSLMLDWFPNIDHLPVYVAKEMGYFSAKGVDVNNPYPKGIGA